MKSLAAIPLLALSLRVEAAESSSTRLVNVPSGQVEAIWLSPVKKENTPEKKPSIFVKVGSFQAQVHQVTNAQFKDFLTRNPEWAKGKVSALFADEHYLNDLNSNEKSPAVYVSWFSARAYCRALGMRLPTINEWEYIAAASETKKDANREEKFLARILEWYGEPKGAQLKPVGSIYKNVYGIWDLHGLVWEWVEDFNSSFVTGESREDSSFNKDMFCGAGSMSSADKENYAAFMRFAFRSSLKGRNAVWNLGFRCVM